MGSSTNQFHPPLSPPSPQAPSFYDFPPTTTTPPPHLKTTTHKSPQGHLLVKESSRALEIYLTWKDQIYDSRLYFSGDDIKVGSQPQDLYVPALLESCLIGTFENSQVKFFIHKEVEGVLYKKPDEPLDLKTLCQSRKLVQKGKVFILPLHINENCVFNVGLNLQLHARYTRPPRRLAKSMIREPDHVLRQALLWSGGFHFVFLLLALIFSPLVEKIQPKNLPPRTAKLLIHRPDPTDLKRTQPLPPPPPPQPLPPKVAVHHLKSIKNFKRQVARSPLSSTKKTIHLAHPQRLPPSVSQQKPPSIQQFGALSALENLPQPTTESNFTIINKINLSNAESNQQPPIKNFLTPIKNQKNPQTLMGGGYRIGQGLGSRTDYSQQEQGVTGKRNLAGATIGKQKLFLMGRTEGLTQQQVQAVVHQSLPKIQQCYEQALLERPQLSGRVDYEWEISPQGKVIWAKIKRSDIAQGDTLHHCVIAVFKAMTFPQAKNGESTTPTIGFPFGRL